MSKENESLRWVSGQAELAALLDWIKKHSSEIAQASLERANLDNHLDDTLRKHPRRKASGSVMLSPYLWTGAIAVIGTVVLRQTMGSEKSDSVMLSVSSFLSGFAFGLASLLTYLLWKRSSRLFNPETHLSRPLNRWDTGPWQARLDSGGFELTSACVSLRYRWSVVWSIEQTETHLMFLTGTLSGYVVPRTAFRSHDHCAAFFGLARRYKREDEQAQTAEWVSPAPDSTGVKRSMDIQDHP